MTDDPKWQGSGYSPTKAWRQIQQVEINRKYEKNSSSPVPLLILVVVGFGLVVAGVIWTLGSFLNYFR